MAENAIVIEGIRKSFGAVVALREIHLTIPKGRVVGLLGPNGAGKTTIVRILATLLTPDAGSAKIEGYDVVKDAHVVRQLIGLTGQFTAVDESLTGRENLVMVARLYHLNQQEARKRAEDLLAQFGLTDAADRQLKTYSGGMRRRIDIAASLINRPPVLFLDEPTTGLDPQSRTELWQIIRGLVAAGTTLLLTTQYLEEADQLANSIVVINHGRIISHGTPQEIKRAVGGDLLSVQLADDTRTLDAVRVLTPLGSGRAHIDQAGQIELPIANTAGILSRAIRALDEAHLEVADIHLRHPTLDEAFLKLVGPQNNI